MPRGGSKKLHHPWTGPWRVIKQISDAVYHIQGPSGSKQKHHVVHFDQLKPCARGTEFIKPPPSSHRSRVLGDDHSGTSSHEFQPEIVEDDDKDVVPAGSTERRYPQQLRQAPWRYDSLCHPEILNVGHIYSKEGAM